MSNNRYLEFDSAFRNRNEWPLPGEFVIPISQSGRKGRLEAVDPTSEGVPIMAWTSNNFDRVTGVASPSINVTILPATHIASLSDPSTLIIQGASPLLQNLNGYYNNAVLSDSTTISRRIISYTYLGVSGVNSYGQITLNSPIPDASFTNSVWTIKDPSDFSTTPPCLFIPNGKPQTNAYTSYLIYNETLNQYRPIINYDPTTSLIYINTTTNGGLQTYTSGPLTGGTLPDWLITHNFSLRLDAPNLPLLGSGGVTMTSATINTIQISAANSTPDNFYKNYALRIIPKAQYEYALQNPINISTVIQSSSWTAGTLTLTVSPSFTTAPVIANTYVEILNFSYDNLNPFQYTGSLVSQQQMVCYEIALLNVVIPNTTLNSSQGGRIAFYPYIYVEISNISASGAGLTNIIYSNNPNSTRMIFRAPIYDVTNPLVSAFVNTDGDGMTQTIKFKPNDNLYFTVRLPNGEIYQTLQQDTKPPAPPNPYVQISAAFSIKRLN